MDERLNKITHTEKNCYLYITFLSCVFLPHFFVETIFVKLQTPASDNNYYELKVINVDCFVTIYISQAVM